MTLKKMPLVQKIFDIIPGWFFTEVTFPLRYLQIYVRGDAIILIPFSIVLLVVGLFSLRWMALLFGIYFVFRFFGEMMYWLLQQFGNKQYRPYDFGFKNLDNNAIYVIYQLVALVWLVFNTGFVIFILMRWF